MNDMEQRGGNIMKRIIAIVIGLTILSIASSGFTASPYRHESALCAAVQDNQPSAWVLQRLGNDFFEQENIRTVTSYPVAVQSVFTKGRDDRIYIVSRWHDFDPEETYTFSCEWIDPDGQSYSMSSASVQTPENFDPGIFFTYTAYLDLQGELKEGQWTVNLLLNGDLVEARDLMIASE
jgi:hypothetical protein